MRVLFACVVAGLISGCMGQLGIDGQGGGSGTTGGGNGSSTGGGSGSGLPGDAGLPCEVANLLASQCTSCHGAPLAGSAPMSLRSRADLLVTSTRDPAMNYAQRSLARMRDTASPMPPGNPPPTAEVDAFAAWIAGGMLEGSCAPVGPPVLTCTSNRFVPMPTLADEHASPTMAPGLACISCHTGQNFAGQNPGGLETDPPFIFQFMGTVFRSAREQPLCSPSLGVAATVEILDSAGTVVLQLPVNAGGNFYGSVPGPMPSPYTARVVTAAGTRVMAGAQTSGDCNTCHTPEGLQGAPGRIYLP